MRSVVKIIICACLSVAAGASNSLASLGPSDVLILVNADSPISRWTADLYRVYHPGIADTQVLYLDGLADSASPWATPATEIMTRVDFEALIAQPVRNHLIANNMVDSVYCIITTAGMPYRIEDTAPSLANVIFAYYDQGSELWQAGSDAYLTVENRAVVNAASVESELAVLFQIESGNPAFPNPLPIANRLVNPYQGYASGIQAWVAERDILNRRNSLRWTVIPRISRSPRIEGEMDPFPGGYSAKNRRMSPADIYLVARLDGPRPVGGCPSYAILDMMRRAAIVSNPNRPDFVGYDSSQAVAVIDGAPDCPSGCPPQSAITRTVNVPPQYDFLTYEDHPVPPGAEAFDGSSNLANRYDQAFQWLVQEMPTADVTTWHSILAGLGGMLLWDDTNSIMNGAYLSPGSGIIGLLTYGKHNVGDGRPANYLLASGPGGGPLLPCVPGATFASIESFNAVTMFNDGVWTFQGRIAQFIEMGGTAAIGHAFEPEVSAIVQGDYLLINFLRDDDGDGIGDLTFVEAAFSALPYLSWSEVVIGDPLMRLHAGPGALVKLNTCRADMDRDGDVDLTDFAAFQHCYNGPNRPYGSPSCRPVDFDADWSIDSRDFSVFQSCFNGPNRPPAPGCFTH
ncbi:MAG: hypothetical protein JXA69_14810 [Phycisphaerae bacterium]|nr:hypothetical protein [Phycisphaerae bacterium]